MNTIANTALYTSNNPYLQAGETRSAASTALSSTADPEKEEKKVSGNGVSVFLSDGVAEARVRENMGLEPTGRLKLGDFKDAADAQEKAVQSRLEQTMETLGIDPDQEISLSLDADFNIIIAESFDGKAALEKALNNDPEFEKTFKQMSANKEVVNYVDSLVNRGSSSLASFMDDNTSWDDILSMAKKYGDITSGDADLVGVLGLSKMSVPYTYVYEPDAEVA